MPGIPRRGRGAINQVSRGLDDTEVDWEASTRAAQDRQESIHMFDALVNDNDEPSFPTDDVWGMTRPTSTISAVTTAAIMAHKLAARVKSKRGSQLAQANAESSHTAVPVQAATAPAASTSSPAPPPVAAPAPSPIGIAPPPVPDAQYDPREGAWSKRVNGVLYFFDRDVGQWYTYDDDEEGGVDQATASSQASPMAAVTSNAARAPVAPSVTQGEQVQHVNPMHRGRGLARPSPPPCPAAIANRPAQPAWMPPNANVPPSAAYIIQKQLDMQRLLALQAGQRAAGPGGSGTFSHLAAGSARSTATKQSSVSSVASVAVAGSAEKERAVLASQLSAALDWADEVQMRYRAASGVYMPWALCGMNTGVYCPRRCFCVCCRLCCRSPNSAWAMYGAGVSSYFKTTKWFVGLFLLLSLLQLPAIVLLWHGAGADETAVGGVDAVSSFTLGNLGDGVNVTTVTLPYSFCGQVAGYFGLDYAPASGTGCQISKSSIAYFLSHLDLVGAVCMLALWAYLKRMSVVEQETVDAEQLTVDDYTVMVRALPPNCTVAQIQDHFETITGCKIAEVHVARDEGKLIDLTKQRGHIVQRQQAIADDLEVLQAAGQEQRKVIKLRGKYALLKQRRTLLERAIAKERGRHLAAVEAAASARSSPLLARQASGANSNWRGRGAIQAAFITFETVAGYRRALHVYAGSSIWCLRQCQRSRVRMQIKDEQGKVRAQFPLKVEQAPPASNVQWHNLSVGWKERTLRRGISTVIAVAVLAMSFGFLMWTSVEQEAAQAAGGNVVQCPMNPDGTPILIPRDRVEAEPKLAGCFCSALPNSQALRDPLCRDWLSARSKAVLVMFVTAASTPATNMLLTQVMKRLSLFERHHSIDAMSVSYALRLFIALFINTAFVTALANMDIRGMLGMESAQVGQAYNDFTVDWYKTVGSGIVITMLLNVFTPHGFPAVRWLVWRARGRLARGWPALFACPWACRGFCGPCCCVWWLVSPRANQRLSRLRRVQANSPAAVEQDLASKAGRSLCSRLCRPRTQRKLQQVYTGNDFKLSIRYAQLLMTSCVTLVYGTGMPILYPVAALSFLLSYWVDKGLMVKYYRAPPHYSTEVGDTMMRFLPLAFAVHLAVSAWMLSSLSIFSSDSSGSISGSLAIPDNSVAQVSVPLNDRLAQGHVWPLVLLLGLVVLAMVLYRLAKYLFGTLSHAAAILSCGACTHLVERAVARQRHASVKFQQALASGRIRGLASYNILANPVYLDMFAISEEFAKQFKSVADISQYHDVSKDAAQRRRRQRR